MRQGSRLSFSAALVAVVTAVTVFCGQAYAASSKYAAFVIDARTGKVLHSENADARRFPASLTKMMTLYLTFEALERGRIKKSSRVMFSAQAASQPPTKIGVHAGGSISVEQAILALVTRSANDASMALAEMLGGSEQRFALMMTQKARSLGMNNTVFRNPHGLPNPGQYTTARDMATLGIALREHFPQYYGYFSVRSFQYGRQRIGNHNKLLGRVKGVDGIKTGYTRASGFNLVSSVNYGNTRIVSVVMGGASGRARDARMAQLINANLKKARPGAGVLVAAKSPSKIKATTDEMIVAEAEVAPAPKAASPKRREIAISDIATSKVVAAAVTSLVENRRPTKAEKKAEQVAELALAKQEKQAVRAEIDMTRTSATAAAANAGKWAVQVGSSPSESEAKATLAKTKSAVAALAGAEAYTVAFDNNGSTYYRSRFAFNSKAAANKACNAAKREKVSCYATLQD